MGLKESETYVGVYRGIKTAPYIQNPEGATIDIDPSNFELPLDGMLGDGAGEELSTQGYDSSVTRRIFNWFLSAKLNIFSK